MTPKTDQASPLSEIAAENMRQQSNYHAERAEKAEAELARVIAVLGFCLIWWGVNLEADP